MGAFIPLSIIGIVVAFLIGVLSGFPFQSVTTSFDASDESYSVEAVQEAGNLFSGNYMALIDEIIAYQKDPDYQRAEARRQDMVNLGDTLTGKFQEFGQRLEGDLNDLTAQLDETKTTTSP